MKKLRNYQDKAIHLARKSFAAGNKKIMIWLATGGGKSVIFGQLVSNLVKKSRKKTIFIVKRRQLIFQAKAHLDSWGIDCGVIMAGETVDKSKSCQVCSIDTINARAKSGQVDFLKDFDVVVVDECHDTTSPTYNRFFEFVGLEKIYFGLTATPFEVGNKVHEFWDDCVKPIEVHELRDQGYLTDAVVYMSHTVDTSGLKSRGKDFKQEEAFDIMKEKRVVGNIVEEYKRLGQNKAAILFAVNIQHSEMMAEAFNKAGIPAIHCDQSTKQKDRDEAIKKLSNGKIKILCNVNIFSTGVDIPSAEIGIMARPTASEILYIQQLGRLLRPFKICGKCSTTRGAEDSCHCCGHSGVSYEKKRAIILDHGENTGRFGLPFDVRLPVLTKKDLQAKKDSVPKESDGIKIIRVRECKACFASNPISTNVCLYCSEPLSTATREVKTTDGTLVEVTEEGIKELRKKKARTSYNQLKAIQLQRAYKPSWVYFALAKQYKNTPEYIEQFVPKWFYKKLIAGEFNLV